MIAYPAKFDCAEDGITVTFPDIPEAITDGDSGSEAMEYAVDAIITIFTEYIKRRRAIPQASKARGRDMRMVVLPALEEAKIRLYEAMREAGVRKSELARRMGVQKSQIDRLLDLRHRSRLDHIEAALAKLHKRLVVHVEDVPSPRKAA
ncbi:MAG: type II toxin-antitoxin system HicB family antitoxin [Bryobacteraceae bacterium]|jgi:antitoxin HicB